jgi:PIN domain nuclease of toxin-antitoxin system
MSYLFDTHLLIWVINEPDRIPEHIAILMQEGSRGRNFSAAAIWESSIKSALGREGFDIDPHVMRTILIKAGFNEIAINGQHGLAVRYMPLIHRDPFDRIMIAQANIEGLTLVTADAILAQYPARVMVV